MAKTTVRAEIQDTYVASANADVNYWSATTFRMSGNERGFIKAINASIPSGKKMVTATLKMYMSALTAGTYNVYAYKLLESLDLRKVTWNSQPYQSASIDLGAIAFLTTSEWKSIALPSTITIEDIINGLALSPLSMALTTVSAEGAPANRPYLEIIYADAPQQPVIVSPKSGTAIDKSVTSSSRFEWQHVASDVSLLPQKGYELQWSTDAYTWTTISATTSTQYVDVTVTPMPSGPIFWRVRTIDTDDVPSDWSEQQLIYIASIPAAPSITNSVFTASRPRIAWTVGFTQSAFQVQILKASETIIDAYVDTANLYYDVPIELENATQYTVRVRAKNTSAIYSAWAEDEISTDYLAPSAPSFEIVKKKSSVKLIITNAAESETVGATILNRIYRDGICIGETDNGTYEDWSAPFDTYCTYSVVAVGENGTAESGEATRMLDYPGYAVLTLTSDPTKSFIVKYNVTMSRDGEFGGTLVQYAGREKPCVEFDEHINRTYSVRAALKSLDEFNAFDAMLAAKSVFLLRAQDIKMYGIATNVGASRQDYVRKIYETSFVLSEVEYDEVIS